MPDDSPPAFPVPAQYTIHNELVSDQAPGMSLRDYFAAMALLLQPSDHESIVARRAYAIADAMITERKK